MPPVLTYETAGHQACERAIRSRLGDLGTGKDAAAHSTARRRSLDLLHLALKEGRLDEIQVRLLVDLLDRYELTLAGRTLPFWPGAQVVQLSQIVEERMAIDIARCQLRRQC
jgi:hypothetical protein